MTHQQVDMITWRMMLRKVPAIVRALPRVVRGMRAANVTDPNQPCGLGWHFEQATLRNPDGAALLYGDSVISYRDANQCANRIAHHLQAQGIRKGDVVALFIENRPELLLNVLAVAKLGGICAMLNTAQTQGALVHSLTLVKPVAIVVGAELLSPYAAVRDQVQIPAERTWFVADQPGSRVPDGYIDLMAASAESPVDDPASSAQVFFHDPCFYIYTSGTTGLPKAGIMKHGRWTKTAVSFGSIALDMGPQDVLYCTLPLYHATGLC
ncbi:MAG: AMP-binding protein, partial [Pseudomonas fluorescens]|nr:AMP-binding protein [Pseudomonas fluorescens]